VKLGKPAPPDQDRFFAMIDSGKCDEAILVLKRTQADFPGWKIFDEPSVNHAGYDLLLKKDYANAIKVFQLNIAAFPDSWNAWDSMAEAYMKAGNKPEAITAYKRSLELNPKNDNARSYLAQFASK
jgi:tetratricopeptide (TPR) repeat protein